MTAALICSTFMLFCPPSYSHTNQQLYWTDPFPLNPLVKGGLYAAPADGSGKPVRIWESYDHPDSVVVDKANKRLFWTNMTLLNPNDAFVQRGDIDRNGRLANVIDVVPKGMGLKTPKQIKLDTRYQKIYFADREGQRVYRAPMNGVKTKLDLEVLVDFTALSKNDHQFVGIEIDADRGVFYWTDRMTNTIWRAPSNLGYPITPQNIDQLATKIISYPEGMIIDLSLDHKAQYLYFSDRGEGNELVGTTYPAGFIARINLNNISAGMQMIKNGLLKDPVGISVDPDSDYLYFTTIEDGKVFRISKSGGNMTFLYKAGTYAAGLEYFNWLK